MQSVQVFQEEILPWQNNVSIQFPGTFDPQVLYISTSVWVLRTPNARRNSHLQRFLCKKALKKQEICSIIISVVLHANNNCIYI